MKQRPGVAAVIQVPGYIIKREIGSGGMATVFLAEQQSLEREVALKVMNAQLATDPNFSRRFLQEARTLASLSHPHIVAVYDVGVTDTGLNYFSMQYLSGGDLAGRIRDGITEAELLPILSGVARALGYAHQRGFVHRDVSPANVMFDTGGSPILTDFGIARAVSRGSSRLTNSGVSVGTSYYMSPEQARGGEVDARSDIYSLGATIFESLTGKPPYEGEDGFAIAYAHVFEPIPRLPPKAAHWQGLIDKALAKDPRERYQDMDAFIAALVELGAAAGSPTTTLVMPKLGSSATVAMPVPTAAAAATTSNNGVAATAQERSTVALPIPVTAESAAVDPTAVNEVPTAFHLPSPAAVPARRPGGLPWPALVSVGAGLAVLLAAGFAYWRAQQPSQPVAVPVNAVAAIEAKRQAAKEPVTPATPTSDTTPTGDQVAGPVNESAPETTVTGAGAASPTAGPQSNPEVDVPLRDDLDLPINPEADAAARQQALAMTAIDPLLDQLTKGQSELTRQKPGSPPSTKALDRFRLALKLAQKFRAVPETEKAKQGILAVAQAYADAAEKRLGEGKIDEFLEQNRRAEETARSLPEGSELATRLQARRNALRDEALAAAKKAATAWDRTAALAAYDRALKLDPNNAEVLRGRKAAERVGEIGYVFRDTAEAPEMVIVSTGGRKLAVARTEITLGEYRRYWSARGAKTRAAGRASCRDRESFFRSSKSRTFESAFDKPELKQESDHPVVCVSWDDAADFARWLEAETGKPYRLPRAAEFEALARASKPAACHANLADNRYDAAFSERDAFKCDDGYAATAKVRSFEADSNGLYDIAGNVREWAGDCAGSCKAHLAMGSAWLSPSDKSESAQRQNFDSDLSLNSVGFRVVRDVD